jgi:hypothetical protein
MPSSVESIAEGRTTDRAELVDALVRVGEACFFAYVTASPKGVVDESGSQAAFWWLATVSFDEPSQGVLHLAVPTDLAAELCAAFLGLSPTEPIEEARVGDLVGELANMTCGAWLSHRHASAVINLRPPVVTIVESAPWPSAGEMVSAAVNDRPVVLWLAA